MVSCVKQCLLQAFAFSGALALQPNENHLVLQRADSSDGMVSSHPQMAIMRSQGTDTGSHRMVPSATGRNVVPTMVISRGLEAFAAWGASALSHVPAVSPSVITRNGSSGLADIGGSGSRAGSGSSDCGVECARALGADTSRSQGALKIDDFPNAPPGPLSTCTDQRPTLGGFARTKNVTRFRIRRNLWSVTGRDLTISNPSGQYVYATRGDLFSWHGHTNVFAAPSSKQLAVLTKVLFSFHKCYEIASYTPVCPSQTPQDEKGDLEQPLYQFARLTELIFTWYTYWDVEIKNCDGSWTRIWSVQSRYWIALKYNYDIIEISGNRRIGTIDQSYYFSFSANYDVFGAPGVDNLLVAVATVFMDMEHLAAEQAGSRSKSTGNGGSLHDRSVAGAFNIAGTALGTAGDR